jgi:UDP-N-acetylglucosamine 2-epimerase
MKLISVIFGTRPEAIKLAPIIHLLKKSSNFKCEVCITGQHKQMLDQVLDLFEIIPDFDIKIMKSNQSLSDLTSGLILEIDKYLKIRKPDFIILQGDTTTVLSASLAAFYNNVPVGHVEAGLRTNSLRSPFPEELNRTLASKIATLHFAPTDLNRDNLIKENIDKSKIFVVGNTVIDTLSYTLKKLDSNRPIIPGLPPKLQIQDNLNRNIILITGHRREKFGTKMNRFCQALVHLAKSNSDLSFVYPVHLNPNVQEPVNEIIGEEKLSNFFLIDPLEYFPFVALMKMSQIIITDSGGIQEEACTLGIPVLLTRDDTERPEAVMTGSIKIVGSDVDRLISEFTRLINDKEYYLSMKHGGNPYGDGNSSERIVGILSKIL